jgi:hypothetical protein
MVAATALGPRAAPRAGTHRRACAGDDGGDRHEPLLADLRAKAKKRAFVETVPPDGLGTKLDLIERIIRDDAEVLELFREVTTGKAGRPAKTISDNVTIKSERGNARPYLLTRLKRSNPELFAKVVAGELSANAAAIEAEKPAGVNRRAVSTLARREEESRIAVTGSCPVAGRPGRFRTTFSSSVAA